MAKKRSSLTRPILEVLEDCPGGLTLHQIQMVLDDYHELPSLSATMIQLTKNGRVTFTMTDRVTGTGRRQVKRYSLAREGQVHCI